MAVEVLDLPLEETPAGDGWAIVAVDYTAGKRCWTRKTIGDCPTTCRVEYEGAEPRLVPVHADDEDASAEVQAILSAPVVQVVAQELTVERSS